LRRRDAKPAAGVRESLQIGDGHKNPQFLDAIHVLAQFDYFQIGNRLTII